MNEDIRLIDRLAVDATEAAQLLGVSRTTIYQYMARKDFPCVRLMGPGGRVLIPVDGLRDWLKTHMDGEADAG